MKQAFRHADPNRPPTSAFHHFLPFALHGQHLNVGQVLMGAIQSGKLAIFTAAIQLWDRLLPVPIPAGPRPARECPLLPELAILVSLSRWTLMRPVYTFAHVHFLVSG